MLATPIARLRTIGFLEAISFLVLLGIAMPLKYAAGRPEMVAIVGRVHGVLFLLYVAAVVHAAIARRWNFERALHAVIAAVVPFGPFFFDRSLRREEREQLATEIATA